MPLPKWAVTEIGGLIFRGERAKLTLTDLHGEPLPFCQVTVHLVSGTTPTNSIKFKTAGPAAAGKTSDD